MNRSERVGLADITFWFLGPGPGLYRAQAPESFCAVVPADALAALSASMCQEFSVGVVLLVWVNLCVGEPDVISVNSVGVSASDPRLVNAD